MAICLPWLNCAQLRATYFDTDDLDRVLLTRDVESLELDSVTDLGRTPEQPTFYSVSFTGFLRPQASGTAFFDLVATSSQHGYRVTVDSLTSSSSNTPYPLTAGKLHVFKVRFPLCCDGFAECGCPRSWSSGPPARCSEASTPSRSARTRFADTDWRTVEDGCVPRLRGDSNTLPQPHGRHQCGCAEPDARPRFRAPRRA